MSSSAVRNRVQAGAPTGGQFAATQHGEADVQLAGDDFAGLSGSDLNEFVQNSSRYWSLRTGADQDDLAQDVALAYLEAEHRKREAVLNGETVDKPQSPGAFIHRMARNIAVQSAFNVTRTEDFEAGRKYRSSVAALEQELGRALTEREKDDLADGIRTAMPPKRRATIGFHRPAQVTSISASPAMETHVEGLADENREALHDHREFTEDSAGQVALELAETGTRGNLVQARAIAWDALAQLNGSPSILTDSVTERHASKHRKQMTISGGVLAVADRWESGTSTVEEEDALFSPFGDLDAEEKSKVVETMNRTDKYADDLWDVALTGATRKRKSN